MSSELIIEGARQNNLKNIHLRLPHDSLIVITGVSGSGKSSLAFDTLFAEGQWRFIESLSTYARLFVEKLDRPDVDAIYNVRPAIALEQRNPVKGSRSTVGTVTELYDLLRILYSKIARPYCPNCNIEIKDWNPSRIREWAIKNLLQRRIYILFPSNKSLAELLKEGFTRYMKDGQVIEIEKQPDSVEENKFSYEVVFDRLQVEDDERLSDSLEGAWRSGRGTLKIRTVEGEEFIFKAGRVCDVCGFKAPEPSPILFSFNHPVGACPECKGFGNVLEFDESLVIPDKYLSLEEGAIEPFEKPAYSWWKEQLLKGARRSGINTKIPYRDLPAEHKRMIFEGNGNFYGIKDFFEDLEYRKYKLHVRVFLSRYRIQKTCPLCEGKRLKKEPLVFKIIADRALDIAELSSFPINRLYELLGKLQLSPEEKLVSEELLRQIRFKLEFLRYVGLGYLTLDRQARTLSGGEYQRLNLSNQLGSQLTGTMYVLDEPTVGLHPRDTRRIIDAMKELVRLGNTIVVVEHDSQVIRAADWVVELGPEGGAGGGYVVFNGPLSDFQKSGTLTAECVFGNRCRTADLRQGSSLNKNWLFLKGARGNNLKDIDIKIPLHCITAVTGVSGSGKSSLVVDTLYKALALHFKTGSEMPLPYRSLEGLNQLRGVRLIDQSPLSRSTRANPATYMKIFDPIRSIFAKQPDALRQGYGPGYFSFNVPGGRCETCRGEGFERLEMFFFEDVYVTCSECNGRRYKPEILSIRFRGMNISDILELTVKDAYIFFSEIREQDIQSERLKILNGLRIMEEIGLGYLRLGQPLKTLSGGEAQRLKICAEIDSSVKNFIYILDEPTVGLHPMDVDKLIRVLRKLIQSHNTVVVIEHNLDLIREADWIIDLGPEGGEEGGYVLYQGPVKAIVNIRESYTGKALIEDKAEKKNQGLSLMHES
ncbi:MAG: excinuclease ABC subunit UvrA [Thermodesulfovibrionales bacterium]|nr:excinuclease ABC subunit UvrA [Thermodesulfovibrionales bacterium]